VLSEFGHIFAPRPDVAIGEMLRVAEAQLGQLHFPRGRRNILAGQNVCADDELPAAAEPSQRRPPALWGDPNIVRQAARFRCERHSFRSRNHVLFQRSAPAITASALKKAQGLWCGSWQRCRVTTPASWNAFAGSTMRLVGEYFEGNLVRQDYLINACYKGLDESVKESFFIEYQSAQRSSEVPASAATSTSANPMQCIGSESDQNSWIGIMNSGPEQL